METIKIYEILSKHLIRDLAAVVTSYVCHDRAQAEKYEKKAESYEEIILDMDEQVTNYLDGLDPDEIAELLIEYYQLEIIDSDFIIGRLERTDFNEDVSQELFEQLIDLILPNVKGNCLIIYLELSRHQVQSEGEIRSWIEQRRFELQGVIYLEIFDRNPKLCLEKIKAEQELLEKKRKERERQKELEKEKKERKRQERQAKKRIKPNQCQYIIRRSERHEYPCLTPCDEEFCKVHEVIK